MKRDDILKLHSMPILGPSYPRGPYRFIDREYLIVTYESDPEAIRAVVPEPLEPDGSNTVAYEFIKMPDSSGFGDYSESGLVIPCTYNGDAVNFTVAMYLDDEPPMTGGARDMGLPEEDRPPKLEVIHDTLTGTLHYAGELVALGTMLYKTENLLGDPAHKDMRDQAVIKKKLGKRQFNLKLIPHVDGSLAIADLVSYNMTDIAVKGAWSGSARLHLVPHVNAPVADLPVKRVIGGSHFIADMTLPYGKVEVDYLKG